MTVAAEQASFAVEITEDPAAFLDSAGEHLALAPVLTTVVSSVTHRAMRRREAGAAAPAHPCWWAVVRDGEGGVAGAAMRTAPMAPHPLFVLPMAEDAARALAGALLERGEDVAGVNGALPAARVVADEVARTSGRTARVHEHTRLFELGELVEPAPVPGRLRLAAPDDAAVVLRWFRAFGLDAAEQAGRTGEAHEPEHLTPEDMAERIAEERVLLWEDEQGRVVHLTGHNLPSFGVARIGPVYTPREHRGRGYASAAVAAVSRRLLDKGARVCLFTDQANPTSNRIYEALGFRPVVDMANLIVDG
jgi:predicted GNAT family acetyltransferase